MLGGRPGSTASPWGPASTTQSKADAAPRKPVGCRRGGRTATGGCQSPQDLTAKSADPSQNRHPAPWEPDPTRPGRVLHPSVSRAGGRRKHRPAHPGHGGLARQGSSYAPPSARQTTPCQPAGTPQERRAPHQSHHPTSRLGCPPASPGATTSPGYESDFQRSITSPGWPWALQRGPRALTPRQKLMGTTQAEPGDRPHPLHPAPSNPQQVFCKDGALQTDVHWLPPSTRAPGWHQGPQVLPLQKGSKATRSLTHLFLSRTSMNPAEIKSEPQRRAVEPAFTQAFFPKSFQLGCTRHGCHCRVHPTTLLPCCPACASPKPTSSPRESHWFPQPQGNSGPHRALQGEGRHLPKGYFEPACVPRASAGSLQGDTALLEQWEGGRPRLQALTPALLPCVLWQGRQLPHTSQCRACTGHQPSSLL